MTKSKILMFVLFFNLFNPAIANAISYSCSFTNTSNKNYSYHRDENALNLFYNHDEDSKTGLVIGNNGKGNVLVNDGDDSVTYIELSTTGAVFATTIIKSTGEAAHSRHSVIFGQFNPHQMYGKCIKN